ncbi:unnamed protein product [Moneuplotes crassus]|uniref:Uncharacterized protein n=1 Tax=Euplotes crassus TaxID=5936 RepID=A0AAD1X5M0_EUPCR|nr:unnamed protein product [Moneuplotes crassus]
MESYQPQFGQSNIRQAKEIALENYYSLDEVVGYVTGFIQEWSLTEGNQEKEAKIALQFPDHLLEDSVEVTIWLNDKFNEISEEITPNSAVFFVLGDTSYGECCVDEVNSEHYSTDLILHFGRTCFTPPNRVRATFVLEKYPYSPQIYEGFDFSEVEDVNYENTIFLADSGYQYLFSEETIKTTCPDIHYCYVPGNIETIPDLSCQRKEASLDHQIMGRLSDGKKYENIVFLANGDVTDNPTYKTLLVNYSNSHQMYWVDLSSDNKVVKAEFNSEGANSMGKFLMQRYNLIEQAKEAQIIGIIMGTLSVKGQETGSTSIDLQGQNLPSDIIKKIIDNTGRGGSSVSHKKYYEILIGKLNEPKIQNFTSVDLFVIVACRENSLYYSKQFGKPVITPYELCIALGDPESEWMSKFQWESRILTDFEQFIERFKGEELKDVEEDEYEKQEREEELQIMVQEYGELANVYPQATIERFRELTFKGLEMNSNTTPAPLQNGKFGIAANLEEYKKM